MIGKKWQKKTESWWRDQRVLTMESLTNRFHVIPAGTVCTVTRKYGGLSLRSEPCEQCGLMVNISKVSYHKLALIDEIVVLSKNTAKILAEAEGTSDNPMALLKWNGKYLVVPWSVASKSPLEIEPLG